MNLGEKSAIEAMLGLSRHNHLSTLTNYSTGMASPLPRGLSVPRLGSPSGNTTVQLSAAEMTSGSSVSPSLSPVQHKRPSPTLPKSDIGRPKAMRLSQLLTDDSPPDASSFPPKENAMPQQAQQHIRLPHSLQLPLPLSTLRPAGMPVTEPVTPPFSPPVLPPLSAVTGLTMGQQVVNNMEAAGLRSTWLPIPLTLRDNNTSLDASSENQGGRISMIKKIVKRPYKKYYSNPTPSSHCHVCARTSKAVKFAICARIAEGLCRKVTCYKCFVKFGWDWEAAVNSKTWVCVHCRGVCPEGRSQCYIYSRVNSKRESKRKKSARGKANEPRNSGPAGGNVVTNVVASGFHSLIRPL